MANGGTIGSIALDDPLLIDNQFSDKGNAQVKRAFDGSYCVSRLVTTSSEGRHKVKVFWVTQAQMESIRDWIEGGSSVTITAHSDSIAKTRITSARGIPGTSQFSRVADKPSLTHDMIRGQKTDRYNGEFEVVGTLVDPT